MRQFAERMVTSFVDLSKQSRELVELQARFSSLEYRVNELVGSNERLKAQIDTIIAERDKARQEVAEVTALLKVAENEREQAKADTKDWQTKHDSAQSKLDRREEDYSALYANYSKSLQSGSEARNHLTAATRELETTKAELATVRAEATTAKGKLERITAALQAVEEVKADITRVTPTPMSVADLTPTAPKEDEPWWKQRSQAQW